MQPPDNATCVRFLPGGDVLSVDVGSVEVDIGSRTFKDVFAPGPGWLFGAEPDAEVQWSGMTRDADRELVFADIAVGRDGGEAKLWPCDALAAARRALDVAAHYAGIIRFEVGQRVAALVMTGHHLLDEGEFDPSEIEADLTSTGRAANDALKGLNALALGQAALVCLDESTLIRPLPAPFRRRTIALLPHNGSQDLTAVTAALGDLGFSTTEIPDQDTTVLDHLERTRMHAAVVVLESRAMPAGDLDRWVDHTLGDIIRIELCALAPARFRTTPEGRLQIDRELSPAQIVDAIRRHAESRGLALE